MIPRLIGLLALVRETAYINDLDAWIPEVWAQESLMILEANMVAANLIHRDFENLIANFGDTVNTRLPAEFKMSRKGNNDDVSDQDANATNVAVKLDQHIHASFVIKDGEESKGFQALRDVYLEPAMLALAQGIDEVVLGQAYQFLTLDDGTPNVVGQLGVAVTKQTVIAIREKMNNNKVSQQGRHVVWTPESEADLLAVDLFVGANQVGDDGTALREASLGRKFGIQNWMSQNVADPSGAEVAATGAVNLVAGYAIGTTLIVVDGFSAAIQNGAWITIAGDDTPQRVEATTGGVTPTDITIFPGLVNAVIDDAVVTVYQHALIDDVAGIAAGFAKELTIDTVTAVPKVGQLMSFGSGAGRLENFALVLSDAGPTLTKVLANRPPAATLANDSVVGLGPSGNYNFAFHKNSLALVTRPLAAPQSGTGALSFVASFNGLSMRVTITYDGKAQGHRVTADMLAGVKVLDRRLGCVVLG
jgi:hypothetical protein